MNLDDQELTRLLPDASGEWHTRTALRDAAVLILLVGREAGDHIVFQRRHHDLPAHAGQIAFPGGARDPGEDAIECALRETHEEVGVPVDAVRVLGRLPERISIAGYLVTPFVGRLDKPRPYQAEDREVVEVFEVPVAAFLEERRWSFRQADPERYYVRRIPYFDWEGERVVWGLTAIILRDFLRVTSGGAPRGELR